jgi:IS4 transposase
LLNTSNDTLLTIRRKSTKIEFADASYLIREETEDGWEFIDEDNQVIYEIELLWNESKWSYTIKSYDNTKNIDTLNQFVSLSLADLARYKSAPESSDSSMETFWFIMWLAEI